MSNQDGPLFKLAENLFGIERCAYCDLLILKDEVRVNSLPMHKVCAQADGKEAQIVRGEIGGEEWTLPARHGSIYDCDFCGAGPGDCHCGDHSDGRDTP